MTPESVLFSWLGPRYNQLAGEELFCKWASAGTGAIQHAYDVAYERERLPVRDRMVRVRWDGTLRLPVEVPAACGSTAVPFWVK